MSYRRAIHKGAVASFVMTAIFAIFVTPTTAVASEPPNCSGAELSTPWDVALPIELECSEVEEEEPPEYEIVWEPEHGEISEFNPEAGTLLYTPDPKFQGLDYFSFSAKNEFGVSEPAYVEIDVTKPYAEAETASYQFSIGGYGFGEGRFRHPADVEVGVEGHVFVLDYSLYLIQEFTHGGEFIEQFGTPGSGNGELHHPSAMAIDDEGDIWVADSSNDRIQQFSPDGEYLSQFGTYGTGYTSYLEGHGKLRSPDGIAIDSEGDIYVSDTGNRRIQKFSQGGEFLGLIAFVGETGPEEFTTYPPPSREPLPTDLAVSPTGKIWYTDNNNYWAAPFTSSMELASGLAGSYGASQLGYPDAIDVDSQGDIWVGDASNRKVVRFNDEGEYRAQFGKWSGYPGGNFDFDWPFGLDVDAHNHIWVTDPNHYRVQRWVEHSGQAIFCEEASATTAVDQPLNLAAGDLGCEGDAPATYELTSPPEHGEISEFNATTGALAYTPDSEYNGPDEFSFEATNEWGPAQEMTFSVEVGEAPKCEEIETSTPTEEALEIELDCSGDFAEGAFEIVKPPTNGEISEFDPEAGTLIYTPEAEFEGGDQFTYQRNSWVHDSQATVKIGVCEEPYLEAGGAVMDPEAPGLDLSVWAEPAGWLCAGISSIRVWIDEELIYSEERNCDKVEDGCPGGGIVRDIQLPQAKVLGTHNYKVEAEDEFGVPAEDVLFSKKTEAEGTILDLEAETSKEGKCSGKPRQIDNILLGTKCDDTLRPRTSATIYRGRGGDDKIYGTGRTDKIVGEGGGDLLLAGRGSDFITGGEGADEVVAGSGDDKIFGNGGSDVLNGGPGADRIFGEGGDDLIRGGATRDRLFGGEGENTLSYADGVTPGFYLYPGSNPGVSLVTGFPGKHGERGVYVNLAGGARFANNGEIARFGGGTDMIMDDGFQDVIGTPFADLIVGSEEANVIDAGAGTDIVRTGGGADEVHGGPDQDYLDGGAEEGGEVDALDGGVGAEDTCLDGNGSECENSNPETTLTQPTAEALAVGIVNAAESSVYLRGTAAGDQVSASGDSGKVTFVAKGGSVFGESSGCTLKTENTEAECAGPDIRSVLMHGGDGADRLELNGFSKQVSVTLLGGNGADRLRGGGKTEDTLVDGPDPADDNLNGMNGDDTLFANKGDDTLLGHGGEDLFVSSELCERDQIIGGPGNDNANWAQLVEAEIEPGNPNYPEKLEEKIYDRAKHGAKIRLSNGVVSRHGTGCHDPGEKNGSISKVENLEGSSGPDVLVGNEFGNVLLGRAGMDVLRGRGGDDAILANNRNPLPKASAADKRDLDRRLECGSGDHDVLKLDHADKKNISLSQLKGCETRPKNMVRAPANYRPNEEPNEPEDQPGDALDEQEIGGIGNPEAKEPVAFYRLDETAGTGAVNWTNPEAPEEEGEEEEPEGESEEEQEEIEAEEEAEEEFELEEVEESPEGPTLGAYEGSVALAEPGAMDESRAVQLDGTDDYIDLTSNWDPNEFNINYCGLNVSGYSVELWVKFDSGPSEREELFSRSVGGEGLFLYRSEDGRIKFSVIGGAEAPTVTSDLPIDDGEWHHVVAMMAQRGETCASHGAVYKEDLVSLLEPEMVLYVDGYPHALVVGYQRESIIPEWLGSAHNVVGAKAVGSGYGSWLDATVDDVAIYGHPLSFDEVSEHLAISDVPQPALYLEQSVDVSDSDEDGVVDSEDNCSEVANPEQEDDDIDGIGDACVPEQDGDEDGIVDELDNCPDDVNPLQEDLDENLVGDVCEIVE
jgi:Ca2+-binding RTX toxin-like protein/DNA-binding beta-propeller fold protein YncE